jgi:hypothetical protein
MINIKDILVNFNGLVKNRLGPYHIVLKNDKSEYQSSSNRWVLFEEAFHYEIITLSYDYRKSESARLYHGKQGVFHLTTAAGDIPLKESDFKQ